MRWLGAEKRALGVAACLGLLSCGGVDESGLFGPSQGVDAGGKREVDSGVAAADAPSRDVGAVDAATQPVSEASTGAMDAPVIVEASPSQPEAAPKPKMVSLFCPTGGSNKCMGPAPIACCVNQGFLSGIFGSGTCEVPADPAACEGNQDALVRCATSADCAPGASCCGAKDGNNQYTSIKCEPACASNEVKFCTGEPNVCASDEMCAQSQVIPPYSVCNPK